MDGELTTKSTQATQRTRRIGLSLAFWSAAVPRTRNRNYDELRVAAPFRSTAAAVEVDQTHLYSKWTV